MMIQMDNKTREALDLEEFPKMETRIDPKDGVLFNAGVRRGYRFGFRDGAASVDRKAIVREAFEKVKEILPSISLGDFEEDDYPKAMDAVLETIGEGE